MFDCDGAGPVDSQHIDITRRSGTRAVGVAWGYHAREELDAAGADRIVARRQDLANRNLSLL